MQVSHATKRRSHAFTLVELMVTMSVLGTLVVIYASMFNYTSNAYATGSGNTERRRNVRALADYIANELKDAMLPVEQVTTTGKGNLQLLVNPGEQFVPDEYRYADAVFWQAPLAIETSFGDIAEIGYFVKWGNVTNGGTSRPMLCRFFVNPSVRDAAGTISRNSNFLIFDPDPTKWLTPGLIQSVAPATKASGYVGLFGENVVGLWVRSYGLDGQELPRSFDSRTGYSSTFKSTDAGGVTQSWVEQRYLPARMRVSVALVDSRHANHLDRAASAVKELTKSADIHDAEQFLEACRVRAATNSAMAALLPGVHVHSSEVQLANAR